MKIARVIIERVTITGPAEEQAVALAWCGERGYRVSRSGPQRASSNRVDLARYKIVAEREARHEEAK
ncbi:MAG: hypothetical protein KBA95_12065 [Acidobacteria bacterium]|nr:hypothetical protein [Acidobacteriota bacterium]